MTQHAQDKANEERGYGNVAAPATPHPVRLLGSSAVVALLVFLVANLLLAQALGPWTKPLASAFDGSRRNVPLKETFTWWITRAYLEQATPPDVVLLGSSLVGSANFAADAHRLGKALDFVTDRESASMAAELTEKLNRPIRAFNWAMGGAMASDNYMIGKALFDGRLKPKMVIVGVAPRDFIDNELRYPGMTEPFRFFSSYVDPGKLTSLALPELFPRLEWAFDRVFPLRRLRVELAQASQDQAGGAQAGDLRARILRAAGTGLRVRPGEWVLPANIPAMFVDNTNEYIGRYRNPDPPIYRAELAFFKEFLQSMQADGIKVMVVGMPLLWTNRALLPESFWVSWRSTMAAMCKASGAHWLDLSDSARFVVDDYLDTVHMNAYGGEKLFKTVAEAVVAQPDLVASLNSAPTNPATAAGGDAYPH